MLILATRYNPLLATLSVVVAIFASFVALDLANSVNRAKGGFQTIWLAFGALAMGFGIWSMHFVGMLAFDMPGVPMSYDIPLMAVSVAIAIIASALALFIVSRPAVTVKSIVASGLAMGVAIAGMHYTGMYSMRMPAEIHWNPILVGLSIFIAIIASFAALLIAIQLKKVPSRKLQVLASFIMGIAIAGMHYTGMTAATFVYSEGDASLSERSHLLATSGLAGVVLGVTALILSLALISVTIDRAFGKRSEKAEKASKLYEDARLAIQALEEERDLRDRFVSALAHDLRNPITAAKMSALLSIRHSTNPELVEKHCSKISANLGRMDQMIQDLLDAHRISVGQALPLQTVDCEINTILRETLEDMTTVYGDRFVLQTSESLKGCVDDKYVRRAVENLCTNAVKYGNDSTPVTVIATKTAGDHIQISVHNQGEAISPKDQEHLFGLFHRSRSAEATGKRGWGLGLTIVKGIAEAHHGSVQVKSEPGSGTTFTLDLKSA